MGAELRRLATLAYRAGFPKILALLLLAVVPSGCTILYGCTPGQTRCKGNVVETCYQFKGWERTEVCSAPETCHDDDPKFCSTYDVACCAPVWR
jgi:hypothetical protein